ncbi:MAG TPA: hypothetical protein VGG45_11910 [Terracidiphilus sp.]|jgi:hypothetical protein
MNLTKDRIRTLNDELRHNLPAGHAVITTGIAALGPEAVARIVKCENAPNNDPSSVARYELKSLGKSTIRWGHITRET